MSNAFTKEYCLNCSKAPQKLQFTSAHVLSSQMGTNKLLDFDYCNTLLCGVSEWLMRRLQSVQNAAAQLVISVRRRNHIMPIL